MIGVWAALPVKGFAGAKQRLAAALTPPQRRALAAAMLEDVLEALAAAPLDGIVVNTTDPKAAALARAWGAEVIADDAATGHTGAVAALARHLAVAGRTAMLALPGDIPRVTPAEIAALCDAAGPAPSFTIAPARDELGSNAVLLAPPLAVPLRFGDDSFFPHLKSARQAGIEPKVVPLPGIGLDIDTPADIDALRVMGADRSSRAQRLLAGFGR
jgi:2-phospho-L-lactate guanylyltransferase